MSEVKGLTDAIDGIESRYYIQGKVKDCPVKVILRDTNTEITFPVENAESATILNPLLKAATVSPFGMGPQTVVDTSVRNAFHIEPEKFVTDFDLTGILHEIQAKLVPEAASVTAKLLKLNIYSPGGHFKKHKDTPRGEDCFGSLVVCLPAHFSDGALLLYHGTDRVKIGFSESFSPRYYMSTTKREEMKFLPPAQPHWVAFFGDVDHEVTPVTFGHRITLSYTLHRVDREGLSPNLLLGRAERCQAELEKLLRDPNFMPAGGELGYYCKHKYEESQLKASEAKLADPKSKKNVYASQLKLKNEDAVLGIVMANCHLPVSCLRVCEYNDYGDDVAPLVMKKMPTKRDIHSIAHTVSIESAFKALGVDLEDALPEQFPNFFEGYLDEDIVWIGSHSSLKNLWASLWTSGTGYFGNEASETEFYTSAALTATVPPYEDRIAKFSPQKLSAEQIGPKPVKATTGKRSAATAGISAPVSPAKRGPGAPAPAAEGGAPQPAAVPAANVAPVLFASEADVQARGVRTIKVIGGLGGLANRNGGETTLTLEPSEGITQLKQKLRKAFGKVPRTRMSSLMEVLPDGSIGKAVTTADLKDGMTLKCTYSDAPGNAAALRPFSGRGFGFW